MKKTLSLVLAICLTICLLPVAAMADTVTASVNVGGKTLKITGYDAPAYSVNTPAEVLDIEDNKFTAIGQTVTTDAENWNAKFVWNTGDTVPTLYLKGFKVDEYNDQTNKWKARHQDAEARQDPERKGDVTMTTGVIIPAKQPTNVVITGEDSLIRTRFGITYKSAMNLKSEGEAKLTIHNLSSAITSSDGSSGNPLNINANLDISVASYYNGANSHMIQTCKADLTIEGGNIVIDTPSNDKLNAIIAREGGNVIIKGGNITATGSIGTAATNGTIQSFDKIIVEGGTLNIMAKHATAMYAKKGIVINGGKVSLMSPYYAIYAGTNDKSADVEINGGTLEITAERSFYSYPKLGANVVAYAGANKDNAEVYDGSNPALAKQPWMIISGDKLDIVVTQPTENIPIYIPPTSSTTAPTQATTAPTAAADTQTEGGDSSMLLIAVAAAILVAAGIVAVVLIKRKKA